MNRIYLNGHCNVCKLMSVQTKTYNYKEICEQSFVIFITTGYAVTRTAVVQLGACEEAFDLAGRVSDQYLQFQVAYSQISESYKSVKS